MDVVVLQDVELFIETLQTRLDISGVQKHLHPLTKLIPRVSKKIPVYWCSLGDPYLALQFANTMQSTILPLYAVRYFALPFHKQTTLSVLPNSGHDVMLQHSMLKIISGQLRAPSPTTFAPRHTVRVQQTDKLHLFLQHKVQQCDVPARSCLLVSEFIWFSVQHPHALGVPW